MATILKRRMDTKQKHKGSLFVPSRRSALHLRSACLSRRHSSDLTCLSYVIVWNPGLSDGPENGLGPADPDGAVSAPAGADIQALHPQGDHPEAHGHQHRRGALMSRRWVWWSKGPGLHRNSLALLHGGQPAHNKGTQSSKKKKKKPSLSSICNPKFSNWLLTTEKWTTFNCLLAAAPLWDMRAEQQWEWDSRCGKKADWPLSSDGCWPCLGLFALV